MVVKAAAAIAYSYVRFSTREQRKGDSLRRQIESTSSWCQRNGVTLDTSLTLHDLGTSAFKGVHHHKDNADKFALAAFLEMCKEGKIAKGSYLIIENLDRLTREHVRAATTLFLSILDMGINIVTTSPEKVYRHDSQDMVDIITAVLELSRGHAESARKSDMVGKAWREKKSKAKDEPVTSMCPLWLKLVDGTFEEIPDRVAVVKRIFRECIEGKGALAITKGLNADRVPPFKDSKANAWNPRAIKRILANRAVLGEYQPHEGRLYSERKPVGEPVSGYYPVVTNETDFYAAQQAVRNRHQYGGKSNGKAVNLFTSLVVDADDETKWSVHGCGQMNDGRQAKAMTNVEAVTKGTAERKALPYRVFEKAILDNLKEVTPADLLPKKKQAEGDRLEEINKQILATRAQVAEAQDFMLANGKISAGMGLLAKLEEQEAKLVAEYEAVRRSLATPVVDALTQSQTLINMLESAEDKDGLRDKLRAKIANVVKKITVRFVMDDPKNHYGTRKALLDIHFHNSPYHRLVFVLYRPFHVRSKRPEVLTIIWVTDGVDADTLIDCD